MTLRLRTDLRSREIKAPPAAAERLARANGCYRARAGRCLSSDIDPTPADTSYKTPDELAGGKMKILMLVNCRSRGWGRRDDVEDEIGGHVQIWINPTENPSKLGQARAEKSPWMMDHDTSSPHISRVLAAAAGASGHPDGTFSLSIFLIEMADMCAIHRYISNPPRLARASFVNYRFTTVRTNIWHPVSSL